MNYQRIGKYFINMILQYNIAIFMVYIPFHYFNHMGTWNFDKLLSPTRSVFLSNPKII